MARRRPSCPAAARGVRTETHFPLVINAGHLINRMRSPVGRGVMLVSHTPSSGWRRALSSTGVLYPTLGPQRPQCASAQGLGVQDPCCPVLLCLTGLSELRGHGMLSEEAEECLGLIDVLERSAVYDVPILALGRVWGDGNLDLNRKAGRGRSPSLLYLSPGFTQRPILIRGNLHCLIPVRLFTG